MATRVDIHHQTALPSVKAGKAVYVEWPLAQDVAHAEELAEEARKSGSKGFVGLQGRLAPPVVTLQDVLRKGRIGEVLSSEVWATGGTNDREVLPVGLKYFTEKAVGGNIVTIGLGHCKLPCRPYKTESAVLTHTVFDQVQHVLGDISNLKTRVQIQRPEVKLRDPATDKIVETVTSDVPDLVFTAGTLTSSSSSSASVSVRFRRGQPFPGDAALVWTINGEKGEIRLKAQEGTSLHANAYSGPVTIEIDDFEKGEVETVAWRWEEWQEELPVLARSVGAVYERFADGEVENLATFESAAVRHQQLNEIIEA